jgi:ribosomal-protein-alanine N-acetyltransferase
MAILETPRLRLRPMVAADATPLLALFGDRRVMKSFNAKPFDRVAMDRWVARNLTHQEVYGFGLFTIEERDSGTVIGDCGLELMDLGAELGYDLRRDRWGRGFATEAASAVRDHAFGELGIDRLVSLIRVGNQASSRVAEKVGMRRAADLDRDGTRYWIYEVTRP